MPNPPPIIPITDPATRYTGLKNSEFQHLFNLLGTNHSVETYPFIHGKLDIYALMFFPSVGRTFRQMVEADGALVARTLNTRDQNGQLIINRFVDALSGGGGYANFARAIGYYTHGFDGEMVVNDINPLIPLTQWTLLNRRPQLMLEISTVVSQLSAMASKYNINFDESNLRVLSNTNEADQRLSNKEWDARFKQQAGASQYPALTRQLTQFREAVKDYFSNEMKACHPPDTPANQLPKIMAGKELRASALFFIAQWGVKPNFNVGHYLLRQHPRETKTWRDYYLPIDIVRRKIYTPHGDHDASNQHSAGYLIKNRLPHLNAVMTEIDKFYAGAHLFFTDFTDKDGMDLARSATNGSLVLISNLFDATYRTNQMNQQLVEYVIPGWANGGRFIITNERNGRQIEIMQRLGFSLSGSSENYIVYTNYDIHAPQKNINLPGAPQPFWPLPLPNEQPPPKRRKPQPLSEFIPSDPDSPSASTSTYPQRLLSWRTLREQVAPGFSTQGRQLDAQVRHAPQAIWLDTDPAVTRLGRCNGLALAWALAPGSPMLLDNLFSAAAYPDDPAAQAFRQAIDQLHASDAARAPLATIHNWTQAVDHLLAQSGQRALLIHIGNHSVALAAHGARDATRLAFFDPNAGVWSDIADPAALKRALGTHFSAARLADYASDGRLRAFTVEASVLNSARERAWRQARIPLLPTVEVLARQDRAWGPLAIGDQRFTRTQLFHASSSRSVGNLARAGSGLRLYGAYRALLSIRDHALQRQYAELGLDLGAMSALGVAESLERGLPRLGRHLPQALSEARLLLERAAPVLARRLPANLASQAMRMFTLSADSARVSAPTLGRLLARGAGIFGNLLSLPFDLFTAIRNFSQLDRLQGLARQDAIVAGSLATIGASAGLALAGSTALGASLSVVGPIGLGLGVLMITTTQIYAAVRQVQEVKQWIALSSGEEAVLGLRTFVSSGILDSATAERVQQARYDSLLLQNAQRILSESDAQSPGEVLYPTPALQSRRMGATCDEDHLHEHLTLGDTAPPVHGRASPIRGPDAAELCPRRGAGHRHSGRYGYEVFASPSDDRIDYAAGLDAGTIVVRRPTQIDATALLQEGNGHSRLSGQDGADTFRLSGVDQADGGAGDDLYLVDRLYAGDRVRIADSGERDSPGPERNVIYIGMDISEFRHARIVDRALILSFASGATLTIQDLYQQRDPQWTRRAARFCALTQDGWALYPALPVSLDAQPLDIDVASIYQPEELTRLLDLPGIQALARRNSERQRAVLFNFGSGNDTLIGAPQRRNIFLLGSGNMTVTGGARDDLLTLNATPNFALSGIEGYDTASRRAQAQHIGQHRYTFDGGAGNDTLQLATRFVDSAARGYRIDLAAQRIGLLLAADAPAIELGTLRTIENLVASAEGRGAHTRHELLGDEGVNLLIGTGQDRLEGRGGDDVLQASGRAEAYGGDGNDLLQLSGNALGDGGAGRDRYQIALLSDGEHVTIQDGEGDSVVLLNFALQHISDWRLAARNLVLTLRCGATITLREVDPARAISFITQDGFILDPELPVAGDAADFTIVAHYVKPLDHAYAADGQGIVLNLEQRTLAAQPRAASAPADARIVGPRQGRITHSDQQAIVLNADASAVRLSLRYQVLDDQPLGDQLLSFSQLEFVLSLQGTELSIDARPWLDSGQLALTGGQGQLRFPPGALPQITSRDGYRLSWGDADAYTFRPAPTHQAVIDQARALRDEHLRSVGSAPETLINRFSAMEILGGIHEISIDLTRTPASATPWQAAGTMTLGARYRVLGVGSAHDDILIGAARDGAVNLLLGHGGDDQLTAGAPGSLLCGGAGADRYRIDLVASTEQESHYLDNLASDGVGDTLEIRTELNWRQMGLTRADDDLWLGGRADAAERGPAVVVLDYYRQPERRHLALELMGTDGVIRTRLSASELEHAALVPQTPVVMGAYHRPAALAQLIEQMARMDSGSSGAIVSNAPSNEAQGAPSANLLTPS